jgi:hypothetical protein
MYNRRTSYSLKSVTREINLSLNDSRTIHELAHFCQCRRSSYLNGRFTMFQAQINNSSPMRHRRLSFQLYFLEGYTVCNELASSGGNKLVPRRSNHVDWYIDQEGEYLIFFSFATWIDNSAPPAWVPPARLKVHPIVEREPRGRRARH